ncbi:MAG: ATP-binding protein [Kofleriaceae bacterium]
MSSWEAANWIYLRGELERITAALVRGAASESAEIAQPTPVPVELIANAPAIVRVARALGLTPFERDVVLACAAAELVPDFAKRTGVGRPTLGLLMNAIAGANPAALSPGGALRKYRIVTPLEGAPLLIAPLMLDETIVHVLMGSTELDERLAIMLRELVDIHHGRPDVVDQIAATRAATPDILIGLTGTSEDERQAVAAGACATMGLRAYRLRAVDAPMDPIGRAMFRDRWERERRLHPVALVVELERETAIELLRGIKALVTELGGLVFLSSDQPVWLPHSSYVSWELRPAERAVRLDRLKTALGPHDADLEPTLDRITTQFVLLGDATQRAVLAARAGTGSFGDRLWQSAREQARPRVDDIARRIDAKATWDDLVLPPATLDQLRELSTHVVHRTQVLEQWGFGARSDRGLGTGALFAGSSGTGKTLAAEVLAREAKLDLYRIDLSQVVNKYIGETEKNLRRVFDAAEDSGAILLFDEADSLFGKRGEVDKGTDRYANLEISYLLQRMEQYRGLAILTTNQRDAIDTAFTRRLRFIINFPFPDTAERIGLWQRAFPATAPSSGIDVQKLARLKLPGGNIRSIALNAAFIAAESGEPISMQHVLRASRAEFAKIERPFPEMDVRGWV